ncbi:MAG: Holliday junction branch migration protein RuvA [Firmicutes bacterium]|nr:Holliday junction branch migration protein RuvA [Bacillota bacterium]MBR2511506.1 Holliday junction branch migration protein RuvA [Bacillota bacterium]MDO4860296.1 Holliday junction branch migration protein RuvA [Bacillota bacterium]
MIHYIKGTMTMKFNGGVVVETGGIGYEVFVPENSAAYLKNDGDDIMLYTVMQVREDDVSLYGFTEREAMDIFNKLITVSGVGAKAAMAILSAMPLHEVKQAIIFEDAASLTRANGIGKKTAQRVVLELKDKIGSAEDIAPAAPGTGGSVPAANDEKTEAINALVALGYSKNEAVNALARVNGTDLTTEDYIKEALKTLF